MGYTYIPKERVTSTENIYFNFGFELPYFETSEKIKSQQILCFLSPQTVATALIGH